ncbi:MAG: excinuclease ABC subunit C [Chlorobiaceae bacterium]|nr:excinuclease ABC subunit C [Chlorobiaceae bacterium]
MGYSVYILQSERFDRYYVGQSENPERRLEFHNSIEKGFTSRYRPWKLIYKKEYLTREEAIRSEKLIKAWKSKEKIRKLVVGEITF